MGADADGALGVARRCLRHASTAGERVRIRDVAIVSRQLGQRVDRWGKSAFTEFCVTVRAEEEFGKRLSAAVSEPDDVRSLGSASTASLATLPVDSANADCQAAKSVCWAVQHRYSAFRALHQQLLRRNDSDLLPPFPGRRLIGSSFEAAFLDDRQRALDTWLRQLVSNQDSLIGASLVAEFLQPSPATEHTVAMACPTAPQHPRLLPSGLRLADLELLRVVGQGSFGKVAVARLRATSPAAAAVRQQNPTGATTLFAVKALRKSNLRSRKQMEHARTERRVMASLPPHPFIATLHASFQSRSRLFLVMDFVPGGELFFHLGRHKRFPERAARVWAAELLLALEHLHARDVMFRDLKPENVLLDANGHAKLIDFGLSKDGMAHGDRGALSFCGTPEYLAPEVLNRRGHGKAVDFWSLGMVLYEMLCGLPPFFSRNKRKLFARICAAPLKFPRNEVGPEARALISELLVRDPAARLGNRSGGAAEVRAHGFFAELDWARVLRREEDPGFRPEHTAALGAGEPDTCNFDAAFTAMALRDSADEEEEEEEEDEFSDGMAAAVASLAGPLHRASFASFDQ